MLRHLDFLIDIINQKIIEHFRLNIQPQITIYLEKSFIVLCKRNNIFLY